MNRRAEPIVVLASPKLMRRAVPGMRREVATAGAYKRMNRDGCPTRHKGSGYVRCFVCADLIRLCPMPSLRRDRARAICGRCRRVATR